MSAFLPRRLDDRGRLVESSISPPTRAALARCGEELLYAALFAPCMLLLAFSWFAFADQPLRWFVAFVGIAAIGSAWCCGRLPSVRRWARRPHCLSCRYDLTGLNPEEDGCTVCPECGAAWELEGRTSGAEER